MVGGGSLTKVELHDKQHSIISTLWAANRCSLSKQRFHFACRYNGCLVTELCYLLIDSLGKLQGRWKRPKEVCVMNLSHLISILTLWYSCEDLKDVFYIERTSWRLVAYSRIPAWGNKKKCSLDLKMKNE